MIKQLVDGILFDIKVIPNSSKKELIIEDDILRLKITDQPIENKANKAVIEYLSKSFRIAKSNIVIAKGSHSKEKSIKILTNDINKQAEIISKLTNKA